MSLKAERGRHKGQSKDRERRIENKKFKKKDMVAVLVFL